MLSNHDNPRHRTRYGSEARARAAAVLLLTLRGTPFLYAGEELGLEDAVVPPERVVDPGGRDGCRAPIPWTAAPGHGWPAEPWLPWPPEPDAAQRRGPAGHGDAEVGDLQRTRGREHEVLGLDVAVEDPSRMCGLQRTRGRHDDSARLGVGEARRRELRPHRAAGEHLHDEEAQPVLVDEVEHRDDVRMVEGGEEPRLLHEPDLDRRVLPEAEGKLLDGDGPAELAVLARDHDAHGAASELGADVVGRQRVRDLLEVGVPCRHCS